MIGNIVVIAKSGSAIGIVGYCVWIEILRGQDSKAQLYLCHNNVLLIKDVDPLIPCKYLITKGYPSLEGGEAL
jgi:hypothetical protein